MKKYLSIIAVLLCWILSCRAQVWIHKQDFPVNPTTGITSQPPMFAIGGYGYVYTGDSINNFYQFDPALNVWTQKADFPGMPRVGAMGFSIGNNGYVGAGVPSIQPAAAYQDFYQYDATGNTWTTKANYPDSVMGGMGFSIGNFGYFGGGFNPGASSYPNYIFSNKFYQYSPSLNDWIPKASVPGQGRLAYSAAALGNTAYFACGSNYPFGGGFNDFWIYNSLSDTWISGGVFPGGSSTGIYPAFAANGHFCVDDFSVGLLRIYDTASGTWSANNLYPCNVNCNCEGTSACAIGGNGYIVSSNRIECGNTATWEFNPALHFTITNTQTDTVCAGTNITVTVASDIVFDSSNYFQVILPSTGQGVYGGTTGTVPGNQIGTYTFTVPATFVNQNPSVLYNYYVTSTNPVMQTYNQGSVVIKNGPRYIPLSRYHMQCQGSLLSVTLGPQNSNQTYLWYIDSLVNSIGSDLNLSLSLGSPTQENLIVLTTIPETGCTARDTMQLTISPTPDTSLLQSTFLICPNSAVTIGVPPVTNYSYNWSNNQGFLSSMPQPIVSPALSSYYMLTVSDTTTGCTATKTVNVNIKPALAQGLCMVTVDTTSSYNIVVWEKLDKAATDSFYINREIVTDSFKRIGAVSADSLSEFRDYAANPNITSYQYTISALDTCGNEGPQSDYHNTVHVLYLGGGNVEWNLYTINHENNPVLSYDVYRDSLAIGDWRLLVSVPGNQTSATDPNYTSFPNARYRVLANWAYTCTSRRSAYGAVLSNVIRLRGVGISGPDAESPFSVSVMPNPSNGVFAVHFVLPQNRVISSLIYDVTGRLIYSAKSSDFGKNETQLIDLRKIASGTYLLRVSDGETVLYKQIQVYYF